MASAMSIALRQSFSLLIDVEQVLQGELIQTGARAAAEEHLASALSSRPALQEVEAELGGGLQTLIVRQVVAIDQVLVHADRPVGFAATAEQATPKAKVQPDGLVVDSQPPMKASMALSGCSLSREVETGR